MFTTGTAVVLCSVDSLTYNDMTRQYGKEGEAMPVALELYQKLTDIQIEMAEDTFNWIVPVCQR